MKLYALAFLLTVCLFENAAATWRDDVKINHYQHINDIVNSALSQIQSDANSKGTPAAQQCYEDAKLSLRTVSQDGYRGVNSCVRSANTQGDANVCAQQVDSTVFDRSLTVSRDATACINKA